MKVFNEIAPLRFAITKSKAKGKSIGFVPTMGNLHEGHLSLLRACVKENDLSVLSIYVNPTQFSPNEDLNKYPRTLEKDLELAESVGCKAVFIPNDKMMYPESFSTYVVEEKISLPMEGEKRPGHFKGVLTVVSKLFNIVESHRAYFGQKDAQQALLIKKMVSDLNMNIEIKILPTVREKNGLAMSSRNNYLSKEERERAGIIYKALLEAKNSFDSGENKRAKIIEIVKTTISKEPLLKIDYVDLRSTEDFTQTDKIDRESVLAISASINNVHLIDNIVLK